METGKFKAPPPMTGPIENQNKNKFCEFHGDKGHSTDECIHLRRQIEEASKENMRRPPRRGKPPTKRKLRAATDKKTKIVIEAEVEGHLIHRMYIDGGSASEGLAARYFLAVGTNITDGVLRRWGTFHKHLDELHGLEGGIVTIRSNTIIPVECKMVAGAPNRPTPQEPMATEGIKVAIHPEYPEQTVTIGESLSKKGRMKLCNLLKDNLDIFAWKPADMTGVPRSIAKHLLNIRKGCQPIRQKRRGQAPDRNKAIQEEVAKLVEAEIMREVHYHDWLSNLVMMAEEDEEKMDFHTNQGVFCHTKMTFDLKNAGATYQRIVHKAFEKQIGQNLEVYVDDLVIKCHTEHEILMSWMTFEGNTCHLGSFGEETDDNMYLHQDSPRRRKISESPILIGDGDGDVNQFPDGDEDGDGNEAEKRG
ncbi:hypothetical protein Tco_0966370 [Tanacetum coccineum]